jgi:hypothetical protein
MLNRYPHLFFAIAVFLSVASCVDPYQMETNTFEEAIVVEASISNQLKKHTIKITKTYKLEETDPTIETGATVFVADDAGNSYDFSFQSGLYVSDVPFQAVAGRAYTLNITASDGTTYQSSPETLTAETPIESVTANVETKDGQLGVQISVNSNDPTRASKYYRYEYEETYKVIAPFWSPFTASVILDDEQEWSGDDIIVLSPRTYEAKTCYTTNRSTELFLTTTVNLTEDHVVNFPMRFISVDDPIIQHRYSIKVTQYVQSLAAHTFYATLKELSTSGGNILDQNQPGFIYGNLHSVSNENQKVIGFFEVSAVDEQRIFFNFEDIFPNEQPPGYHYECEAYEFDSDNFGPGPNPGRTLRGFIIGGNYLYYIHYGALYYVVRAECGDCTVLSSNIIPEFWE